MRINYYKYVLLILFISITCNVGLCGVINHSISFDSKGQKSRGDDYMPLLEEGKTWKYSLVDWSTITYPTYQPNRLTEHLRETRLEGYETINGETYMKLNVYYDGSDTPAENNPMYYLKEDSETGIVTFLPNESFVDFISWEDYINQNWFFQDFTNATGILYNFKSRDKVFSMFNTLSETTVELGDGEHNCYVVDGWNSDGSTWRVIEGIGLTCNSDKRGCSILGPSTSGTLSLPDSYYNSFLYEVVNGAGEIIYTDEKYRPGWWKGTDIVKSILTIPAVDITSAGIYITNAPNTEAYIYDTQGRVITHSTTDTDRLYINTATIPTGIYLLSVGSHTYKIAVK